MEVDIPINKHERKELIVDFAPELSVCAQKPAGNLPHDEHVLVDIPINKIHDRKQVIEDAPELSLNLAKREVDRS